MSRSSAERYVPVVRVDPRRAAAVAALRGSLGLGRAAMLLVAIWGLGLVAVLAVVHLEGDVDASRRAQVVIAKMRNQEGALLSVAFAPATSDTSVPGGQQTSAMDAAKRAFDRSTATLVTLSADDAPIRIQTESRAYFRFVDRLARLVRRGAGQQAAFELGASQQPGGVRARLTAELDRADLGYDAAARQARSVALLGTVVSIAFLLVAFTIAFQHSVRARRRSQREATTDVLTGLGNRRKLFVDSGELTESIDDGLTFVVGMFDLDGFKSYNDRFGHPAGDALLARLGNRLADVMRDRGRVYRMGGDEFVVVADARGGDAVLAVAQAALSEQGEGFAVTCSVGWATMGPGTTLEQALHDADRRLYANKRSSQGQPTRDRAGRPTSHEVKDALLQVLAEQSGCLVTHLGQVAELAERTARRLGLEAHEVELTRLGAELHDIGKAAIPASILDKPGPLSAAERSFVQRHSEIGERILAAAPTLEAVAPIVRSAHERMDGTGYPDRLRSEDIPVASRVIAVVDAFDAMTTDRPYRRAVSAQEAIEELRRHAGTQFDPAIVEAFIDALGSLVVPARLNSDNVHALPVPVARSPFAGRRPAVRAELS